MDSTEQIITHLPSLVRRLGGERVKKAKRIALENGGLLKRIRRSRNWHLICNLSSLQQITDALVESYPEEMGFLISKFKEQLAKCGPPPETTEEQLTRLIVANPNITLAELINITNCTISEARKARFALDLL